MIWYFLAGWISGAVGMVMYSRWWVRKHTVRIMCNTLDALDNAIKETMENKEEKSDDRT